MAPLPGQLRATMFRVAIKPNIFFGGGLLVHIPRDCDCLQEEGDENQQFHPSNLPIHLSRLLHVPLLVLEQ